MKDILSVSGFENEYIKANDYDLVCLSHLRWNFVYQRPQHLLSRFAKTRRVFFFEEPIYSDEPTKLEITSGEDNLFVVVPHISNTNKEAGKVEQIQREMLDRLVRAEQIKDFVLWFNTPTAFGFASHLKPRAIVYDCMDELSAFKFAPPELLSNEKRLLEKAALVFTGGQSLYEAKKNRHERVYAFPSSIDTAHFRQARNIKKDPADQKSIASPKLGYCGVIDERIDISLLAEMADLRPEWQFVMIGPVVKIKEEDLPRRANIHYLGGKDYKELPKYMAGWNIALMPFAINESTKFISPTKTPEYLAAGKPVVSTPIRDVVRPYGEMNLVHIASTAQEFVTACEKALRENSEEKTKQADEFLAQTSWDKTFSEMANLIDEVVGKRTKASIA
ncbi:MAG: glycosyltransferase family 1 protein [Acidobacteria bacterium]|nr:glycosyltransferase family 1 protein [Acidobacteriota bacterium]